jgi:hypothetical protein
VNEGHEGGSLLCKAAESSAPDHIIFAAPAITFSAYFLRIKNKFVPLQSD